VNEQAIRTNFLCDEARHALDNLLLEVVNAKPSDLAEQIFDAGETLYAMLTALMMAQRGMKVTKAGRGWLIEQSSALLPDRGSPLQ
jgi:hypothetical protein